MYSRAVPRLFLPLSLLVPLVACDAKQHGSPTEGESQAARDAKNTSDETKAPPPAAPANDVELDAAKAAFGCDAPADPGARRACAGLDAFAKGQRMTSFPSEGTRVFLARTQCSKDPNGMITFAVAKLSPGGGIEHQFEAWPGEPAKELTATRIIEDLARGGAPSEPSPNESVDGYAPKSLSSMKETWAMVPAVKLELEPSSSGQSLLEQPERPSAGVAYWRELDGQPLRVAPPHGNFGWCVNRYYPVPDDG